MKRGKGGLRRKGITSLSIITTPVIILAGIVCILIYQQAVPTLFGQVASGSSIFIPSIPVINLLGFVPDSARVIPFTIGNLVDVIFDVYILLTIGIIPYRWHKSARELGVPIMDLQRHTLLEPADSPVDPRSSGSCSARGSTQKCDEESHYSDIRSMTSLLSLLNPRDVLARRRFFSAWPLAPKTRKIPVNVFAFVCLSKSAFYPSSRSRLHGAVDGRRLFLSECRVLVTDALNHITKGWR